MRSTGNLFVLVMHFSPSRLAVALDNVKTQSNTLENSGKSCGWERKPSPCAGVWEQHVEAWPPAASSGGAVPPKLILAAKSCF